MKKIITLILALLMITSFLTACELVELDKEADANQVIATVNGEEILKKEYTPIYEAYSQYYQDETQLAQLKTDILDMLINQKLWEQKAKAAGYFNYTEEQRAAAKAEVEKLIQEDIAAKAEELKTSMADTPGSEGKDYLAMAKEQYERDMIDNDDTVEKRTEDKLKADAMDQYKEDQLKDVNPLEADIIDKYNTLKQEQNETITEETKADYVALYQKMLSDLGNPDQDSGNVVVKNLSGYIRVQHILIKYNQEDSDAITKINTELATLESEAETLKTDLDAETDTTKKAELQTQYDTKNAELTAKNTELETAITKAGEGIKDKATEVLNSVKGKDEAEFIKVMLEKTEDTGMKSEAVAKQGYLVGDEDGMDIHFHDGAQKLQNAGDISDLVGGIYGYHIIRKIDNIKAEVAPLDGAVRERIVKILTEEQHNTKWTEMFETWTKEAKIKKYTKRLD